MSKTAMSPEVEAAVVELERMYAQIDGERDGRPLTEVEYREVAERDATGKYAEMYFFRGDAKAWNDELEVEYRATVERVLKDATWKARVDTCLAASPESRILRSSSKEVTGL